ncbi:MAG TPA: hypothetical protein PLW99_02925 [Candidatus Paceibacterota bacterium]|nr:hypothetical protein [Candidatus Paceibacterota bacterium]
MTIAMIVIGILMVYLINHKVSLVVETVSQTQNIPPVPPTEVHRVLGIVEKVSGREVTLKDFRKISSVVSAESDQSARMIVLVNQSTVIERFTYKDAAVLNAELDAFYKNIQEAQAQSPSVPPMPPEPFTLENITVSDIKIGDRVIASFAEDVAHLTTGTATKIEIQN